MTATLTCRYGSYVLTVTNTRTNRVFEYPCTFACRADGLAFALTAGIGTVVVSG